MKSKKTILISLGILLSSGLVTALIFFTQPEAERVAATKKTAMLVDVITVKKDDYRPIVVATGTVQPAKDINLSPRVNGEIISLSENFTPGSFVNKGDILMQIDPADYQNQLLLRQSDLQLAESDLQVEMGRQDVAQKDYELIGEEFSGQNKSLILRQPQLASAKANVIAARAAVKQAELNLERTTIRAPFDAHIISRNVNVGSQVAPGDMLGRLVGMDEYWVIANVPLSKMGWLSFADKDEGDGSDVKLVNDNIWPSNQYREGKLYRMVGALNNQTRLARVLVTVKDPLARTTSRDNVPVPPLMIGTFVEAQIKAAPLTEVIRLSRDYLRKDQTVWVMKEGKLQIRNVDVIFEDPEYAYISNGLADEEMVVTTNLATVVEGSLLRVESDSNDVATKIDSVKNVATLK